MRPPLILALVIAAMLTTACARFGCAAAGTNNAQAGACGISRTFISGTPGR
jgi:hypothetical protein